MADDAWIPVPPLAQVVERLPVVFPEGIVRRNYLVREIAAKTVFVMLYASAIEGLGRWIRPNQVTRMTDRQSRRTDPASRAHWTETSLSSRRKAIPGRWYADTTREPIRDETIRFGLILVGAVIERPGLPVTSAKSRHVLTRDFADLFTADAHDFVPLAEVWRAKHLTAGALARVRLIQHSVSRGPADKVPVTFPNSEVRLMSPGPSSEISKFVIEQFAPRFLAEPGVVFLSESRSKVVARDEQLARDIGLNIEAEKLLPDIVLVDLAHAAPLLVFVEVVASDGSISDDRKARLLELTNAAGYDPSHVAFVTALLDRGPVYRKVATEIAWDSFVWFASEPDCIIIHRASVKGRRLSDLT